MPTFPNSTLRNSTLQNSDAPDRQRRTVRWVVAIAALALLFDGYDLVVYGTVVSTFMQDPSQLGQLSAAQLGALGSYALMGVMVGALTAGAIGDRLGRRRMMLINIVWFSVGMAATAMAHDAATFGVWRFVTGLGVGALVATAGAMIAEFAPAGKRNFYNAVVYSGVPAGGVMASVLAIILSDAVTWRGLFWIGALPILFLFPLALVKLPESPLWLLSRGRPAAGERVGFRALAGKRYRLPTALLGMMSFCGLLLTYGLNTWLPQIMAQYGYDKTYSLMFLLTLNFGAIIGGLLASRSADRLGAQRVIATTFGLAALSLVLLTLGFPLPVLLLCVAIAGVGTLGTQVLIYGFVSNYYVTSARAAGVAWCAGFGRLGGIFGPLIGGLLISAGVETHVAFYVFGSIAVLGGLVTFFVPGKPKDAAMEPTPESDAAPSRAVEESYVTEPWSGQTAVVAGKSTSINGNE